MTNLLISIAFSLFNTTLSPSLSYFFCMSCSSKSDLQNVDDEHFFMLITFEILSEIASESHAMWVFIKSIQHCKPVCRDSS